ncbi:DoxX family protein [Candidatus Woesearchaeota archaeon]|nr:DoxX family protein [Candidatus Woesearchaeota archaeon]
MIAEKLKPFQGHLYLIFRVFVGLLFLQHGLQKVLGSFGGVNGASLAGGGLPPLMVLAGLIEFAAGLAVALGLLTRLAAAVAGVEMLVAYFQVHAPLGIIPLQNQGELALLYFAAFVALTAYGSGRFSLDKVLLKKEL